MVSPMLCETFTSLIEAKWLVISSEATGAEKAYHQRYEDAWYIIGCWIAYKRHPVIDIARHPYNTVPFQAFKLWAYVLNAQLDLAQVTFDAARSYPQTFKKIQHYLTPMNWWLRCMKSMRRGKPHGESPSKEIWIRLIKNYATSLSQGKMPEHLNSIHEEKLLKSALTLGKRDPEVKAKLEGYIRAIEKFAAEGARRFAPMWVENKHLLTRERKNSIPCVSPQDLERIEKGEARMSMITHGGWQAQLVSVIASKVFSSGL